VCSIHVTNLSESGLSAAELLTTTNDIFFVRFLGYSNTSRGGLKTRAPICTKLGGNIDRSSRHTQFKNGEDIMLGFKTTTSQRPILNFLTPCVKIRGGVGQISKSVFRAIIYAPETCLDFRCVASFRN